MDHPLDHTGENSVNMHHLVMLPLALTTELVSMKEDQFTHVIAQELLHHTPTNHTKEPDVKLMLLHLATLIHV